MYENKNIDDNVMLFSAKFLKQREYWKNQLTTDINNTDICFDSQHKSKRGQKATLNRTQVELTHDTYNRLLKLGKQSEFSNYIILLAALKTFIYRYTGNNDITVVSPLNALNIKSETINNFVYVRDHIQGDMTFKELILKIKETILQAYNHQDYPIGKYLEYLFAGPHGKDDKYISNILCSLNTIHSQGNIKELEDRLSFLFHKEEKRMICTISYDSSAYEEYCIDQIKNHFIGILEHGLRDVNTKILEIPFISSQEKKRLLFEFNNTGAAYSKDKTIRQLFEEQVERTPGHIALVGTGAGGWCMDTGEVQARLITAVTYAKLNKMADILAGRLLSRGGGAGTGTIAAIMTYPMLEMMIAIFAVLKTGACYLPIDPGNPKGRIAYLLKDSEARFLLTHSHYVDIVDNKNFKGETLYINDECLYWPGNKKAAKTGRCGSAEDPVYIIYTSGTTGNPKGVLITHANVVNYVTWFSAAAGNLHTTKAVLTSSFAFDLGYTSIYPTLLNGAQLHLLSRGVYMVPELLLDYIHVHEIGFMKLSPSLLSIIVADNHFTTRTCRTLTLLVLGGEPIQVEDVEKAYRVCPHLKVMNHYGPTETTVGCIARFVEKGALDTFKKRPTIGKPIFNTKIYILDNYLNLLPPGLAGGLYIGGEGVGMGYLNNPELTAEKFIMPSATRNPFEKGFLDLPKLLINNQSPLYRTGDSARWLPDGPPAGGDSGGVIEFLGRIDRQMKIRGYRIELGEIENRLLSHSDIKKACVLTKEGAGSNQQYLVAYIIAGKKFAVSELREYLSTELPDYMIPSFFVQVEDFPLTPNGKINVKAFPGPPALAGSEYIAPRNEIEEKLAGIWRAVLGGDTAANSTANPTRSIGIDDNFFELGGHSLRATILVSRIHKTFNVKLPLAEVFSTPTIRGLAKYINGTIIEKYEEIHPVECKEYYKLSSVQHRLYFLQQMDPAGTVYDMPVLIPLAEDADLGKVEEALKKLIRRHESLRTSFHIINNETVQRVHTRVEFAIEKIDFTAHPGEVIKSFFHPFDLSKAPLMRVGFFRTGEGKRFLMITLHHIITDGISQLVLNRDFISYYKGDDLPALRLHYKDFSEWQNSQEHTGKLVSQEAYWLKEFAGEIPVLNLPQDFPRPALQSFEGNFLFFNLNPVHYAGLQRMAKTENVTMFMILLSVTNVLLSKLGDSEDIITGTPIAGRRHPDLEKIIGMFVNTLALRNYPVGRKNFREFLQEIKDRTLKAFENQEYQFEDLVAKVLINRDRGRNPLFDVMFVVQNYTNKTPMEEGGPRLENQLIDKQNRESYNYTDILRTSRFDLTIAAREEDQGRLTLTVEYCTKLFKKKTIERFIAYFQEIIAGVVEEPGAILSQIEIIPEAEKQWLLFDLNRTRMAYPQDKTIHQLFDEQGERNPDRVVVVGEIPAGQMQITHRKVNNRSNHIASLVKSKGLARGSIIGIMTEPRLETVIGIAGILKAGCTFLPLEPGSPPERVNFALKDSNTSLLLTQGHLKVKAAIKANIASINLEDHSLDNNILESPNIVSDLSEPVYVIYTSGTSGRPKGVLITNKNIVNYAHWLVQTIPLTVDDRTILTSSLAFDLIYTSFFSFLFVGCQLHVIPRETYLFPGELISYLEKNKITYIKVTPSLFNIIVNSPGFSPGVLKTLRLVMLGGEQINVHDVEKAHLLCPHLRMMNHYGPTETTIGAIARFIDFEKFAAYKIAPTIGKPIHNVRVYILDKALHVVPLGVAGGLYLSGDGVGMGYLNNPELTCKKFRPQITQIKETEINKSFFGGDRGAIFSKKAPLIYCTGDLARWHEDGNIEFLGRADDQVKIRGHRIELEEIEKWTAAYPGITEVVLSVCEEENSGKCICVYLAAKDEITFTGLRNYLAAHLPDYMIPTYFVKLEKIPLTINGKVDRKALPDPRAAANSLKDKEEYIPPQSEVEKKLVEVWEKVLGRTNISMNDNFFQVGGDSIKSIQIISRMNSAGYRLEMRDIFQYPIISELTPHIKKLQCVVDQSAVTGTIPLTPIQEMFFAQGHPGPHHFNQAVMFYSKDRLDKEEMKAVFTKIQEHHDALRMTYKINKENSEIIQYNHSFDYPFSLEEYEIDDQDDQTARIEYLAEKIQAGIDLEKGPMMKLGLFHLNDGDRLLIVIHHLVIDGISWRILFEDIETLCSQYKRGEKLILPAKSDSFKIWAEKLQVYANSETFLIEKNYWQKIESLEVPCPIPRDFEIENNHIKDIRNITFTLTEEETEKLFTIVNKALGTGINDILLTALAAGIKRTFGQNRILIALEGHGREEILEDINIERTVGWFSIIYPVLLDISQAHDLGQQIKEIKETLRRIPNRGIGYGILKYLTKEENKKEIQFKLRPQIRFDYLGQFDADVKQIPFFEIAKESSGNPHSLNNLREHDLYVSGLAFQQRLTMSIAYNEKAFKPGTAARLLANFEIELKQIIAFCLFKHGRN